MPQPPLQIAGFDGKASRKVMWRLPLVFLILAALIALNHELLNRIYFENQITTTGYLVNGATLALFLIGILRLLWTLNHYRREEMALGLFIDNIHHHTDSLLDGVPKDSLIHHRHSALVLLQSQHTPINHGALAAALVAAESTRTSLPKFINNILILTGVFGTVLSLSIALLGASHLLNDTADMGSMSTVMHGMSTALSTTITAIVCYLIFGYFYLQLTDVQTRILGAIEEATSLYLLPAFQISNDNLLQETGELVRALMKVTDNMQRAQRSQIELEKQFDALIDNHTQQISRLGEKLDVMSKLLIEGFRLDRSRGDT